MNSFFTQINCKCMPLNVGIKLFICEENGHFFPCTQLKTQTCFEAVQAVRVPKHLRHQKYFLFMSIHLKLKIPNEHSKACSGVMIHVITNLFNTFTFAHTYALQHIMPAWTLPLNQLRAIMDFDSCFKSLSVSLSFASI